MAKCASQLCIKGNNSNALHARVVISLKVTRWLERRRNEHSKSKRILDAVGS